MAADGVECPEASLEVELLPTIGETFKSFEEAESKLKG